jgi:MerR family copper efflux transcriptional regulator
MVAVVGIQLGQCRDWGRQQAEQRHNGGSRAHRGNAANGSALPCTLPLVESQVVSAPPVKPPLKIGEVANRSGRTVKTIRFYCDEGLIQPISRSDGGYRLFDDGVFSELALIRTLRAMEIPLPDVRQILEARRSGVCTCSDLKARIRSKAGDIGAKITAMQNLQTELFALLNSWEACGGRTPAAPNPMLVAADR